jgi:hypothetical protein
MIRVDDRTLKWGRSEWVAFTAGIISLVAMYTEIRVSISNTSTGLATHLFVSEEMRLDIRNLEKQIATIDEKASGNERQITVNTERFLRLESRLWEMHDGKPANPTDGITDEKDCEQ